MLPSTEIESNVIVAHLSTRSSRTMSMENLSIVLNAASEEQQSKLRDERNPTLDISVHLNQGDRDFAASFNRNEIPGKISILELCILIKDIFQVHIYNIQRDTFMDERITPVRKHQRRNICWYFSQDMRFFVCERMSECSKLYKECKTIR